MNMYFTDRNDRTCRIDVDRIELIQQHPTQHSTIYLRGGTSIIVQLTLEEFEIEVMNFKMTLVKASLAEQ